ncbi:hypothetical protein KP509_06G072200 [Ceratopteris richardii]|uniref:Uncharacterized protein n=1 Tax=Ceratopteris richardii TaxID=49495 RepID=A0A8T2UQH8_CERRI|nr:hypothetical protein KP509_06G072200 [Ceratopteris richardii]
MESNNLVSVPESHGLKTLLAYLGPGFLVAIAYIDPGNFESDLHAGAKHKYELLWIIVIASCAALLIQSLAANLGVVTVLGTAFALNLLFNIPVWGGVLATGLSTLVFLALQQYGVRKLEFLIAFMVFTMAACFLAELAYARPSATEVLKGMFIPQLSGAGATGLAVSLLGAMVMPHNLFLHSALVLSRKTPRTVRGIKDACKFYVVESAFALLVAFLINVSVISVSGTVCANPNLSTDDRKKCEDLDLNQSSFLLRNVLGSWSSKLFGIALLASGQSSTITGTYAGQYVMQGFLNLRLVPWVRNLLTRMVAICPSLLTAILGGSSGAGNLIIISSMILSFELPFALLPLLKFTSCATKMGPYKNPIIVKIMTWVIGCGIMAINLYYLSTAFYQWLVSDNELVKGIQVLVGVIGFSTMLVYILAICYLAFRTEKEVTYLLSSAESCRMNNTENGVDNNELELHGPFGMLPREDLVNMQLPQEGYRDGF